MITFHGYNYRKIPTTISQHQAPLQHLVDKTQAAVLGVEQGAAKSNINLSSPNFLRASLKKKEESLVFPDIPI